MTQRSLPKDAGLSLLETLAALAVVAVMTGMVVVSMGSGLSETRKAADRLVTRLAEAREFALVSGEVIGFAADADQRGWRFFHAADGQWQVIDDHPALEAERLPSGQALFIAEGALPTREEAGELDAPQVLFDPTGFDQPFSYVMRSEDERFMVQRDGRGGLFIGSTGQQQARAS